MYCLTPLFIPVNRQGVLKRLTLLNWKRSITVMRITLNLKKTVQQNANEYFERAKESKKKTEGAKETIGKFQRQLEELERKQQAKEAAITQKKASAPREWYEKFRWFVSSEGFLCIGGRDATSNEVVIKKHVDKQDIIFHTEMPGSPFFVIKAEGKTAGEATLQETADATASFSKAWKMGFPSTEVFSVLPDQVSKKAESGEYLPKGGFMVRGKRTYYRGELKLGVGLKEGRVMAGPEQAVKKHCETYAVITPGDDKPSDTAKKIAKKLNADLDDVLRSLPAGNCKTA